MKHIVAISFLALSCTLPCCGDLILGHFELTGANSFFDVGYGRDMFYDLISPDGGFELRGAAGDGIQQIPGTFTGNIVQARDSARLDTMPRPQTLVIGGVSSYAWVSQESRLFFNSAPVVVPVLPIPPTESKVLFSIAPTPFTMTGHITVTDYSRTITLIDTNVSGSGLAYMKASAQDLGGINPMYIVYSTDYVFANPIPEPSAAVLLCTATALLGGYAFLRRRRQRL